MVRNVQTTSATGLRKNRVTQKTRLRIVRGQPDEEAFMLDDEEERNKVLASQGVDAEDANEHHLQAVLNGHHKHATHATHTTTEASSKQSYAHIPIPDAAGIVEGYDALYPVGKYQVPTTHLRFSETVEEIVQGGLASGFTYFLDEKDEEWIVKNNQEVRGEGTSANTSTSTTFSANAASDEYPLASGRGVRRARVKGKDPEHANSYTRVVMDEDEFELVMGLFEKFTEEKFPFIHLALDNFPAFADYEPLFATALSSATFASYIVPTSVPSTERLIQLANNVYPHWKARRVEREGQRVVPQLDYDDTHESSYICFRRRDAKPVRRTRASSTAYTDKLARLRAELHMGLDLVKTVLEREQFKAEAAGAAHEVWRMRCQLVEDWRAGENKVPGVGIDESLLFDKDRMPKKPKVEGLGRIVLGLNRRTTGPQSASGTPVSDQRSPLTAHLDLSTVNTLSAQGYVAVQNTVRDRHKEVQGNVDREVASLRTRDNGWEDLLDLPYQPTPVAPAEKAFRSWPPPTLATSPSAPSPPSVGIHTTATPRGPVESSTSRSPPHLDTHEAPLPSIDAPSDNTHPPPDSHPVITSVSPASERLPRSLRLRTGRGGRLHLDRRLHTRRTHPLLDAERARWPREDSLTSMDQRCNEWQRNESERESKRWEKRDWQPKPSFETIKGNKCTIGSVYWGLKSVYADETAELGKRKRPIHEGEAIGFERCGYGLGLATYAEWENGPGVEDEDPEWKPEPRVESEHEMSEDSGGNMEEILDDNVEHALRVEERWRYDTDHGRDEEDRVMLDDFQPKFLRTMVTLLDSADHDTIMTDSKYLAPRVIPDATPLATRSSTRLGDQERVRLASLKSQRVSALQLQPPPALPSHPPVFQAPPAPSTTPPLPLPQIASGRMDEQIRRMARQTPSVSPTTATPQTSQRMSVSQASPATPTPPQQNGSPLKSSAPFANGIAVDSGATVRVSSPVRPKSHTPSPQQQQPQSQQGMAINGFAQHQAPNHLALHPGHAHNMNTQQYASLRNVFADRVPGMQQQQQPNRMIPGANVNLQVGPGNLNLKLPPTRAAQLRMGGSSGEQNVGVQSNQMQSTPPRPNGGSPSLAHARGPSVNGHYMTPTNGRVSPGNAHLLGRASPLAHTTLANSPHHHSHLGPLHSSQPQSRPTAPLPHQQVVGGAGQGHGYS